VLQNPHQILTG